MGAERVAVLTTSYPATAGDAAGHFVQAHARSLAMRGAEVTVFAPGTPFVSGGNPGLVRLADGGAAGLPGLSARLRKRPSRAFGLGAWLLRVRREFVRRGPFDRVVAHWLLPSAFPLLVSVPTAAAELEAVVHGSDARLLERLPRAFVRTVLTSLGRRRVRVRCVSQELATLLRELGAEQCGLQLEVGALPIDCSGVPSRSEARRRLGIGDAERLVLVVARLVSGKRVRAALTSARLLPPTRPVVIGDGPQAAELMREFPEARFLGQLPRDLTLTWIAAADAVLSASRLEGSPSVIREARALGVPVAALGCGDLTSWAETDAGLWVAP